VVRPLPKYGKHRASGQAIVRLSGVDYYLGPYGSKVSKLEYDRVVGEWLQREPLAAPEELTVVEIVARYLDHAEKYYRKAGQPTREYYLIRDALRPLRDLYGGCVPAAPIPASTSCTIRRPAPTSR
jgi:hypothetical protein